MSEIIIGRELGAEELGMNSGTGVGFGVSDGVSSNDSSPSQPFGTPPTIELPLAPPEELLEGSNTFTVDGLGGTAVLPKPAIKVEDAPRSQTPVPEVVYVQNGFGGGMVALGVDSEDILASLSLEKLSDGTFAYVKTNKRLYYLSDRLLTGVGTKTGSCRWLRVPAGEDSLSFLTEEQVITMMESTDSYNRTKWVSIGANIDKLRVEYGQATAYLDGRYEQNRSIFEQTATSIRADVTSHKSYVDGRIVDQNSQMLILSNQISTKVSFTEFNPLLGRMVKAESSIIQNAADIRLKASQSEVDKLSARVSSAEILIDGANANILLKAEKSVVDALGMRLTSAEVNIDGAAGKINLLTSRSDGHDTKFAAITIDSASGIQLIGEKVVFSSGKTLLHTMDDKVAPATDAANAAKSIANQAKADALTANTKLASISDDNKLVEVEKSTVIMEYAKIINEQAGIDTQLTAYGVSAEKISYDSAITALTTYLNTLTAPKAWNDISGETSINGVTFRTKFNNVYQARQVALNAVYAKAKSIADSAVSRLNDVDSDNKLTPNEKLALRTDWEKIVVEKAKLETMADTFGVTTEKATYQSKLTALGTYLNGGTTYVSGIPLLINDSNLSTTTDITGTTLRTSIAEYGDAASSLLRACTDKARVSAGVANAAIADIASDNIITPSEKRTLMLQHASIINEQAQLDGEALSYGITTEKVSYDSAITALTTYLNGLTTPTAWNNLSGNTNVDGATLRGKFTDVYTARGTLLGMMYHNARSYSETLDTNTRNAMAQSLGYNDYNAFYTDAITNGNTIIKGGYIQTNLINTDAIMTKELVATSMIVKGGSIGDFTVNNKLIGDGYTNGKLNGNQIMLDPSNNEIVLAKNGAKRVRLTNNELTALALMQVDGGTKHCTTGTTVSNTVTTNSILASKNDIGIGGAGVSKTLYAGISGTTPQLSNSVANITKISLNNGFYSMDVPISLVIVHSKVQHDGRYDRITGTNSATVTVKLMNSGGVVTTQVINLELKLDTEATGNDTFFVGIARLNFTVPSTDEYYIQIDYNVQGGSDRPIRYQTYTHATTFRSSYWSNQYDYDVQYDMIINPGMTVDGSIGITELSNSGFQSVWTPTRYLRIDGNTSNDIFIESQGRWLHNGIEIKFDKNTITGYIDQGVFATKSFVTQGYYNTEQSDARYLSITATAADSSKLGGQLPSYYYNPSNFNKADVSIAAFDVNVSGILNAKSMLVNKTKVYSSTSAVNDILNIRRYSADYTLVSIDSPPQTSLGKAKESTLAICRGDNNEYFMDLYNMDYGTVDAGNFLDYGDAKMGLRMQKRGVGKYTPFHFEYGDGTNTVQALSILPNTTSGATNATSVKVWNKLEFDTSAVLGFKQATDLNAAVSTDRDGVDFYRFRTTATNIPTNIGVNDGFAVTLNWFQSNYALQLLYDVDGTGAGFRRRKSDGTWDVAVPFWHGLNLNRNDVDFTARNITAAGRINVNYSNWLWFPNADGTKNIRLNHNDSGGRLDIYQQDADRYANIGIRNARLLGGKIYSFDNNVYKSPMESASYSSYENTGAIQILLPPSYMNYAMVKFTVNIYNYAGTSGNTLTNKITVFGYCYNDPKQWYNYGAEQAEGKKDINVRFGHANDKPCIWIDELDVYYSYPKITITDVMVGHEGYAAFAGDFSIGFVGSFGTVTNTAVAHKKYNSSNINRSDTDFVAARFSNGSFFGNAQSSARNHFVQFNAGTLPAQGGWIAAAFGDATSNRVVVGQYDGKAVLGSHNGNLDAWAPLYITAGGNAIMFGGGIQSDTYTGSGFTATGWGITTDGDANFRNHTVRGKLTTYEFVQNKISIANGNMIVSDNAKVSNCYKDIDPNGKHFKYQFSEPHPFNVGDYIRIKTSTKDFTERVDWISSDRYELSCWSVSDYNYNNAASGDFLVRWNSDDAARKGLLYLCSSDAGSPNYQVIYGGAVKAQFGNLEGRAWLGSTLPTNTWGLWAENAYLSGAVNATSGKIGGWFINSDSLVSPNNRVRIHNGVNSILVEKPDGGYVTFGQTYVNGVWNGRYGFCTTNGSAQELVRFDDEVNRIAGWNINTQELNKYNDLGKGVVLNSLIGIGTLTNWGSSWTNKFNIDGSGLLASGNIAWDAAGNISFSDSVKLQWTSYDYASGECLHPDMYFANGTNGTGVYNNNGNGTVTQAIISKTSDCPSPSGKMMRITFNGAASPGYGGFTFLTQSYAGAKFITRIIAKIPVGCYIAWGSNGIGDGNKGVRWLTPTKGTGQFEEYRCIVECGYGGSFSSTNYFYLDGSQSTWGFTMDVAMATVYDITKPNKQLTRIGPDGIYAGKIKAENIEGDLLSGKTIRATNTAGLTTLEFHGKAGTITGFSDSGMILSQLTRNSLTFNDDNGIPGVFLRNGAISLSECKNGGSIYVDSAGSIPLGDKTAMSNQFTISNVGVYKGTTTFNFSGSMEVSASFGNVPYTNIECSMNIAIVADLEWYNDSTKLWESYIDGVCHCICNRRSSNSLLSFTANGTSASFSFTTAKTGTFRFRFSHTRSSWGRAWNKLDVDEIFDVEVNYITSVAVNGGAMSGSKLSNGTYIGNNGFISYNGTGDESFIVFDRLKYGSEFQVQASSELYSLNKAVKLSINNTGVDVLISGTTKLRVTNSGRIFIYGAPAVSTSVDGTGTNRYRLYLDEYNQLCRSPNNGW